jgi:hypothetical protein
MSEEKRLIEEQIREWMLKNVSFPEVAILGKCTRIVVKHVDVNKKPDGDIATISVNLEEGGEEEIEPLLLKIADAAQRDADDVAQGLQGYMVCAYYSKKTDFVARKLFRVAPTEATLERDFSPTEPATEKGLTAQLMRHLESVQRTTAITTSQLFSTLGSELRRLAEQNEVYAKSQMDLMVLLQDTADRSHTRRLAEKSAEADLAVKEDLLGKLSTLIPVVVNRIAGKSVLPEEDKSLLLMAGLFENLSEEQQHAIFNTLNDAQRVALATVIEEYERKKVKLAGSRQKLLTSKPLPAAPTADEVPAPQDQSATVAVATPLRTRIAEIDSTPTTDPVLRKIEEDVAAFNKRSPKSVEKTVPGGKKK